MPEPDKQTELKDLLLSDRVRLLVDGAEAIVLARHKATSFRKVPEEEIEEEHRSDKVMKKLYDLAEELGLIGETIVAMSNGAWAEGIDATTGKPYNKPCFGVVGKLSGFQHWRDRENFVYVFDLPPITEGQPANSPLQPHGYSLVEMGGLMTLDQLPKSS